MTLQCDYCRQDLGRHVHRYWHMQFCSAACMAAYQARLAGPTRAKIRRLDAAWGLKAAGLPHAAGARLAGAPPAP